MGHILGLGDAYTVTAVNNEKIDRCTENIEICNYDGNFYWNIMKEGGWSKLEKQKMRANDFEMMLYAYSLSENGIPQNTSQYYRSFNDGTEKTISVMIKNHTDEVREEK